MMYMGTIKGYRVFIKDERTEVVWQVGNQGTSQSSISGKYLPKSWLRITKLPDDQAFADTRNGTIQMTMRGFIAYKEYAERQARLLGNMAARDSKYL